jgi:hypothetical protein
MSRTIIGLRLEPRAVARFERQLAGNYLYSGRLR